MSIEAVNQFLIDVSQDQQLQTQFTHAMGEKDDYAAGVKLAVQHGYEFTTEELATQIKKVATGTLLAELSEEQLEAIAGGSEQNYQNYQNDA